MTDSLVSVVIPTLNRSLMLSNAINSVLNQTYSNVEIIIIDDCSDNKVELPDNLKSERIFVHRNEHRMGGAFSRKLGTEIATGKYVCFLDDDDEYLSNKIEDLVQFFKLLLSKKIKVDAVFGIVERTDRKKLNYGKLPVGKKLLKTSYVSLLHTNGSLIKKEVLLNTNFYEALNKYQDTQFHMELILNQSVFFLDKKVAIWNVTHSLPQITDMNSKKSSLRDFESFEKLYDYIVLKYNNKPLLKFNLYIGLLIRYGRIEEKEKVDLKHNRYIFGFLSNVVKLSLVIKNRIL